MLVSDSGVSTSTRPDLVVEAVDDELIILDKERGQIHQLNATASIIWRAISAGKEKRAIALSLVNRFEVPMEIALSDIEIVVRQMESADLLE
jgi:hypothetical protein